MFIDGEGDALLEGKNASCSIRGHIENGRLVTYIVLQSCLWKARIALGLLEAMLRIGESLPILS